MIIGLGTDIVELARIEESLERVGDAFAQRLLCDEELQEYQASKRKVAFVAKRFCIKEAAAKALGTGIGRGVSWKHMRVHHNEYGAPLLAFTGGAAERLEQLGGHSLHVSVSDERHYATAVVVIS